MRQNADQQYATYLLVEPKNAPNSNWPAILFTSRGDSEKSRCCYPTSNKTIYTTIIIWRPSGVDLSGVKGG